MSKIASIPASVTLLNKTDSVQLLTGGWKIPASGELTIDLKALDEHRRIKTWDACNNAAKGCVLAIKGPPAAPEAQQVIDLTTPVPPTIAAIVAALQPPAPPLP